jgi:hypothetical protein
MRAMNKRLHPPQPRVARRADLFLSKGRHRQRYEGIAAFVQLQRAVHPARADRFPLVGHVNIKIRDFASRAPQSRIARPGQLNSLQQSHSPVHFEAEVGNIRRLCLFEGLDPPRINIAVKLMRRPGLPFRQHALEKKRREFALDLVDETKIQRKLRIQLPMPQNRPRFPRIVVAVMAKENDLAADFRLNPPRRLKFREKVATRKKPARLLSETDDGSGVHTAIENGRRLSPAAGNPVRGQHQLGRPREFGAHQCAMNDLLQSCSGNWRHFVELPIF